jgi:rubrerythrin
MFTMDDLFDIAIKMERNGEAVYLDSLSRIDKTDVKELLQWMADEEARHQRWFADQKNRLHLEIAEKNLKEMVTGILEQMMGDNTLSLDDIDFSQISSISELMQTFVKFEEDTIMFYQMLEMFIEDDAVKAGLESIVDEEKRHAQKLKEMTASLYS